MKPSSARAKGQTLQKWVRDKIYEVVPTLEEGDVRSTASGSPGEDVLLSPAARKHFPFCIECKNLAKVAVYQYYQQAASHGGYEPLVVVKQNASKPLVVVDADFFFKNFRSKE